MVDVENLSGRQLLVVKVGFKYLFITVHRTTKETWLHNVGYRRDLQAFLFILQVKTEVAKCIK